ncbi:ATP-binding protein [Lentzea aerocolonigenes]|uniref:ATP-binding protein n=1 Tax=Lentzea aerocolonigenes TaxID=68170 RepID=UPI0004C2F0A8|nr:ATP-binding protein [Lentzea aerocolonigenes]MCP2241960.1 AAA ATPase domain-containing protein [Lentzea aerocolonigenes]
MNPLGVLTLVERDAALAVLERSMRMLAAGRSSLLEICGHRGTGRTAVLDHLVHLARRADVTVLTAAGGCPAVGGPGGAVAELMSQLHRDDRGPAAVGALVELARDRPVLVAVDDADLLDAESLAWLASLAGRAVGVPMVVAVVTDACLPVLPGATTVPLRPLGHDGVSGLVTGRFGRPGDDEFATALHDHTGGRPATLRPLLDRCAEDGLEPVGASTGAVAGIAADVLADFTTRAVRSLPAEAVDLLRVIAVCGPSFPADLLGVLAGLRTITLGRALELLVGAGLVTEPGKPELSAGIRVARVLEDMPAQAREDLHARAARLGHQCAVHPSEVARLLVGAPPLGEAWVVPLLRAAAREEANGDRPAEATAYLRRALTEHVTPLVRAELVLELAIAECLAEPVAADRRLARMLLEPQPPECADVRLAAADQLWGRGDAALLRRTLAAVRSSGGDREAVTSLYWIADDAPVETPELGILETAELPGSCGNPDRAGVAAWMHACEGVDAERAGVAARTALDAPAKLLTSRLFGCLTLGALDDVAGAVAGLDLVIAEARRRRLTTVVPQALMMRAKVRAMAGDLDHAAADMEQARSVYPLENLHPDARPIMVAADVLVHLERGDLDRAIELAASQPDERIGFGYARTFFSFARAVLALVTGDPAEAVARADECGRWMLSRQWVNPAALPWRSIAAAALAATGDHERAARTCARDLELAQRWGAPSATARAHLSCAAVVGGEDHLREAVRLLTGSPFRLLRATALLELAQVVDPAAAAPMIGEAAEIAVLCRSTPLIHRARGLGWVPTA